MTDERDPMLQGLFANAEQDLTSDAFTDRVIAAAGRRGRQSLLLRSCIAAGLIVFAGLLTVPP